MVPFQSLKDRDILIIEAADKTLIGLYIGTSYAFLSKILLKKLHNQGRTFCLLCMFVISDSENNMQVRHQQIKDLNKKKISMLIHKQN